MKSREEIENQIELLERSAAVLEGSDSPDVVRMIMLCTDQAEALKWVLGEVITMNDMLGLDGD